MPLMENRPVSPSSNVGISTTRSTSVTAVIINPTNAAVRKAPLHFRRKICFTDFSPAFPLSPAVLIQPTYFTCLPHIAALWDNRYRSMVSIIIRFVPKVK